MFAYRQTLAVKRLQLSARESRTNDSTHAEATDCMRALYRRNLANATETDSMHALYKLPSGDWPYENREATPCISCYGRAVKAYTPPYPTYNLFSIDYIVLKPLEYAGVL